MRKAEKRKIGEQRQAQNREFSRQSGLAAQKRDREQRARKATEADRPVSVRKAPSKDRPKKFGKVTRSFKEASDAAERAAGKATVEMKKFSEAFNAPVKE